MKNNKKAVFLIVIAAILVSFGDLRFLITPLGYWLVWLTWLGLAGIYLFARQEKVLTKFSTEALILITGFIFLFVGFLTSSLINQDTQTLYQGFKLFVILIIGLSILKVSQKLTRMDVVRISSFVVLISLAAFLFIKYFISPLHFVFGDGRQGTVLAAPGTLWKTGCFFSAIALAHFLSSKKLALSSAIVFIMGMFLVFADGSRTGFLWLSVSTMVLIFARVCNVNQKYTFKGLFLLGVSIVLASLFTVSYLPPDFVAAAMLPLERLTQGDSARIDMLVSGLRHAEACLPFGCGFGSAVSDRYDMVVHNAYLGALGDVGVIGLFGFVLIIASPIASLVVKNLKMRDIRFGPTNLVTLAALLGAVGIIFNENFHSFRTEMSEWGFFFLMLSFVFAGSANELRRKTQTQFNPSPIKA